LYAADATHIECNAVEIPPRPPLLADHYAAELSLPFPFTTDFSFRSFYPSSRSPSSFLLFSKVKYGRAIFQPVTKNSEKIITTADAILSYHPYP